MSFSKSKKRVMSSIYFSMDL